MKKTIGVFMTLLLMSNLVFCQILKILNENNQIVNDNNIEVIVNNDSLYNTKYSVINDGPTSLNVYKSFYITSILDGIDYAYCWGVCYESPYSGHKANTIEIPAGDTLRNFSSVYYNTLDKTGTSEFKLVYTDFADSDITEELLIKYTTLQTSTFDEIESSELSDPFPNPVDNYVTFNLNGQLLQDCKIELWSVFGKLLCSYPIDNNEMKVTIPLLDVPEGIVFYRILDGFTIRKTGKIVIDK